MAVVGNKRLYPEDLVYAAGEVGNNYVNVLVGFGSNQGRFWMFHSRLKEREKYGPHVTDDEHVGFNGRLAVLITNAVGTMWCAYIFTAIALVSLPAAIDGGTASFISWVAQTFLQLVLLSVIMVGQKVAAAASDKQALQTYKDAEALLQIQDEMHRLIKLNNDLTEEVRGLTVQIHDLVCVHTEPSGRPALP